MANYNSNQNFSPVGNFGNQNQQITENSVRQALAQLIAPQKQSQLNGRIIQHPNDILPSEVPMDGSISVFPLSDWSAIVTKSWDRDGNLNPVVYIPYQAPSSNTTQPASSPQQEDKLDILIEQVGKLEKLIKKNNYKKPYSNKKQEVVGHEHE